MKWLLLIVALIVLIVILIWITRITIMVDYRNYGGNNELKIKMTAWFGLIRYKIVIPVMKVKDNSASVVVKGRKGIQGTEEKGVKITPEEYLSFLRGFQEILDRIIHAHKILKDFFKEVTLLKLEWSTAIGTGDAALTGIMAGGIWAVKGSIVGLASDHLKMKGKPVIMVTPYFQYKVAGTMLSCMFSFRGGKAILAGIKLFHQWKGPKRELLSKGIPALSNKEV